MHVACLACCREAPGTVCDFSAPFHQVLLPRCCSTTDVHAQPWSQTVKPRTCQLSLVAYWAPFFSNGVSTLRYHVKDQSHAQDKQLTRVPKYQVQVVKNPRCQARHQGYNQANSHKSKPSKQAQTLGQHFCFGLQHSHQCSSLEPKWKTYHSSPTCQLGLKDLQNYPQVTKLDESGSL